VSGQQLSEGQIAPIIKFNNVDFPRLPLRTAELNLVNDIPQFLAGEMVGQLVLLDEVIEPDLRLFCLHGQIAGAEGNLVQMSV